jgi:hypothetical protein
LGDEFDGPLNLLVSLGIGIEWEVWFGGLGRAYSRGHDLVATVVKAGKG